MERLLHLVQCLKPSEVKFIVDFYKLRFKNTHSKRLQLLNLILKDQAKTNQQASHNIYKKKPDSTFCHLKKCLREDILNLLLLSSSSEWEQGPFRYEMVSRRLLVQSKIMFSRGVIEEGLNLVRKASGIAERYEFPDIKLVADDLLRRYSASSSVGKYNQLINQSLTHLRNLYQAKKEHYLADPPTKQTKEKKVSLQNITGGSKRAWFWHQMNRINWFFEQKRLLKARNYAEELLEFLNKEKTVDTKNKRAQTQLCLARTLIHLQEYNKAVIAARLAVENCSNCIQEQLPTLEVLFFANLRAGNLNEAEENYHQVQSFRFKDALSTCKWTLMLAALRFYQKQFTAVNKVLNTRGNANKHTRRWIIGYNFLGTINTLELQDYDWFDYKLDSLRKQLNTLNGETTTRHKLVYNLLLGIARKNYDYAELVCEQRETFDNLNSTGNANSWNPLGLEVVDIPRWIISKASGRS